MQHTTHLPGNFLQKSWNLGASFSTWWCSKYAIWAILELQDINTYIVSYPFLAWCQADWLHYKSWQSHWPHFGWLFLTFSYMQTYDAFLIKGTGKPFHLIHYFNLTNIILNDIKAIRCNFLNFMFIGYCIELNSHHIHIKVEIIIDTCWSWN